MHGCVGARMRGCTDAWARGCMDASHMLMARMRGTHRLRVVHLMHIPRFMCVRHSRLRRGRARMFACVTSCSATWKHHERDQKMMLSDSSSFRYGRLTSKRHNIFRTASFYASSAVSASPIEGRSGVFRHHFAKHPLKLSGPNDDDLSEMLAEYGWKPHRNLLAQNSLSWASFYWYMRETQRGTVSSNSRSQAVLFQRCSANPSFYYY